ncbi:ABC transporter permease [Rhodopseudomonas sp. P1]|uniref:ABC transporter permease n=1 Tax=Rhodopseudomonas sp. P1 TaxID=3434357 RepID=UPI0031FC9BB4
MAIQKVLRLVQITRAFLADLASKRDLIFSLSVRNFKSAYFGSLFGMTWVIVEPLIYVFLLWFFFTKAIKFQPPEGYPYVPWLMTAMALWNFISLTLTSSASTFRSHAFLLKRPEFNMSLLPVVNILTGLYIHGIFLVILVAILLLSGIPFTLYWFQAGYYLLATAILLLGVAWIAASLSLFIKDVTNIIGIIIQIGFWTSPIFWSLNTFPANFRVLLQLNPLSYVMEGYRKSFLYAQPFWNDPIGFAYFWSFTLIVLLIGVVTYKTLRPHFGDVV